MVTVTFCQVPRGRADDLTDLVQTRWVSLVCPDLSPVVSISIFSAPGECVQVSSPSVIFAWCLVFFVRGESEFLIHEVTLYTTGTR